jgi:hypothetical protein
LGPHEGFPAQPQKERIAPEEDRVWLLAQGIQYGNGPLGPLCYQNTRKVAAPTIDFFVAAWETGLESDQEVMATQWDPFYQLWTNPVPLSESAGDAGRVDLAVGPDSAIHACWHQLHTANEPYEVYYSKLPAGASTWAEPVMISVPDSIDANFPAIGVDNANHVTIKWAELVRNEQGVIIDYLGYQVNVSFDGGDTWNQSTIGWAVENFDCLWGDMCVDKASGDVYLVDAASWADPGDLWQDLVVTHYDAAAGVWEAPEVVVHGGGEGEIFHDVSNTSCAVGPDGTVHILYHQTTAPFGSVWLDPQVGAPIGGMPFHVSGIAGRWSHPEQIYPWTDGIYEGIEGIWPDSTSYQFCGYAQVGVSDNNRLYVATRSYEYSNGVWVAGNADMHSYLGFQPEVFIGCLDLTREVDWVWTRASDVNVRPDTIGIKYSKLTERAPTNGPAVVWDETYDGAMPSRVMFTRIADFTAPEPVANLQASRQSAYTPVILSWENPVEEDLGGLVVVRDTVGVARLVGLRRGMIPINADGDLLYPDVWEILPDSMTGVIPESFIDSNPLDVTAYYTVVPFDTHFHFVYPIPDDAVVRVDAITLFGALEGGELTLSWSPCEGANAYWVYGAGNEPWFTPGITPEFEHRLAVLPGETTDWSSLNGIGDPDEQWTYLVMAVGPSDQQLCQSNRVGEHDFEEEVP